MSTTLVRFKAFMDSLQDIEWRRTAEMKNQNWEIITMKVILQQRRSRIASGHFFYRLTATFLMVCECIIRPLTENFFVISQMKIDFSFTKLKKKNIEPEKFIRRNKNQTQKRKKNCTNHDSIISMHCFSKFQYHPEIDTWTKQNDLKISKKLWVLFFCCVLPLQWL